MARPSKVECIDCKAMSNNYYVVKTNKGDVFRCEKCYENWYMRNQRDEYCNYNDGLQQARKV